MIFITMIIKDIGVNYNIQYLNESQKIIHQHKIIKYWGIDNKPPMIITIKMCFTFIITIIIQVLQLLNHLERNEGGNLIFFRRN